MKEKILNLLKSNLFFSVVFNISVMMVCVALTTFSYDSSGDFYNSLSICRNHFYYSNTINYILATLIGTVQYVFTDFNCFVLAQALLSCIAFTSITFVFADKFNKRKSLIISLLLNILFAVNHYSAINSSKTSALLLAGGFLLVLNAINNKKYNLPCWIGVAEIAFGAFFDYKYFFVALGFAIAFFFGDMIAKKKYKFPLKKFFWYFRPYLLMFIFVCIVAVGLNNFSYSVNHATEEAGNYYEYAQLTDSIRNLPYPDYSKYQDEFKEIGISTENDYELLKNGYYDKDHSLNTTALKLVSELQQKESSKSLLYSSSNVFMDIAFHFLALDCYAIIITAFVVITVVYIVFQKRRFGFFPAFYTVTGFVASVLIRYFYSGADYLIYGIWLLMCVLLLYSFNFDQLRPQKKESLPKYRKTYRVVSLVSIAVLLAGYSVVFALNVTRINNSDKPQNLITEIDRHPDKYYVFDPTTSNELMKYTENYMHPMWGFRSGAYDNIDSFGYFHNDEALRKRNMSENIYEAVLSNKKIYVIDKNITFRKERYFTQNYAEDDMYIVYEQIDELNGYKIYEVKLKK